MQRGRHIKTPCRGRKRNKCKTARKSCKYVRGTQRKYCRKAHNTRKVFTLF
jgi:hypothetical protein